MDIKVINSHIFLAQSDDKQTLNFAKKQGFLEVDRRITFSLSRNKYIPLKNLPKVQDEKLN